MIWNMAGPNSCSIRIWCVLCTQTTHIIFQRRKRKFCETSTVHCFILEEIQQQLHFIIWAPGYEARTRSLWVQEQLQLHITLPVSPLPSRHPTIEVLCTTVHFLSTSFASMKVRYVSTKVETDSSSCSTFFFCSLCSTFISIITFYTSHIHKYIHAHPLSYTESIQDLCR